ncbi:hypothetical protein BDV10DRAFT_156108, partial [Aspergillus recurvatus]
MGPLWMVWLTRKKIVWIEVGLVSSSDLNIVFRVGTTGLSGNAVVLIIVSLRIQWSLMQG